MARLTRFTWQRITTGFEILPPTLMVAMGDPWLGAGTLSAVLVSAALQSRMQVRSAQERHQAILSYARDTVSMGGDPSSVIAALQGTMGDTEDDGGPSELPPQGHEKDWDPPMSRLYRPPRV